MNVLKEKYSKVYNLFVKTQNNSLSWKIDDFLRVGKAKTIYFLNAHAVNNAVKNKEFFNTIIEGDYLLRDGIGVQMAFKFFGLESTKNLNGTDLIPEIIKQYKDKKIALFGASDKVLKATNNRLHSEGYKNIVISLNGFYNDIKYIEACKAHNPDIVILCMGMPKQELLSKQLSSHAQLIICGGGWIDFYSGTKDRAPRWIRSINLEWVYRLVKEPKRLGKRYTIDILYYFYIILCTKLFRKKPKHENIGHNT